MGLVVEAVQVEVGRVLDEQPLAAVIAGGFPHATTKGIMLLFLSF